MMTCAETKTERSAHADSKPASVLEGIYLKFVRVRNHMLGEEGEAEHHSHLKYTAVLHHLAFSTACYFL